MIRLTQHIFLISLNNKKVPGPLTTRVIGQGCTTIDPIQDSTASASSLVSAMLILERIISTNSPKEFIEARKEGRAISPALLQPRPLKFTGNPTYLHTFPSNTTLPRESKRVVEDAQLLSTQAILSVRIAALVSQRHSSTKQMIDVGSAPPTLTSFSQELPSSRW